MKRNIFKSVDDVLNSALWAKISERKPKENSRIFTSSRLEDITSMAREALNRQDVKTALDKHSACNWGDVGGDEWARNDEAYKSGGRVVSRYVSEKGKAFLLITEADRSATTILLPGDSHMKRAC